MINPLPGLVEAVSHVGVARAYGTPVQVGGEELMPVAMVWFGFGGGSGDRTGDGGDESQSTGSEEPGRSRSGNGIGGGAGGLVIPVGAYAKGAHGRAEFRPNTLTSTLCLVTAIWCVGHSAARIARALRVTDQPSGRTK